LGTRVAYANQISSIKLSSIKLSSAHLSAAQLKSAQTSSNQLSSNQLSSNQRNAALYDANPRHWSQRGDQVGVSMTHKDKAYLLSSVTEVSSPMIVLNAADPDDSEGLQAGDPHLQDTDDY
jgi:hypothetical protein